MRIVGKQVSFEPIDCLPYHWHLAAGTSASDGGPGDSDTCDEDDLHYRARYRVLTVIDGEAGDDAEFLVTGWSTDFAESRHALLYVLESPDGVFLPPGLATSVYPTQGGGWASCDGDQGSEPLAFTGDLVFGRTDGMSPHGIAQRYPESDFTVIGNEAFCLRGRRLPALVQDLDRDLERLQGNGYPYLSPPDDQAARP